MKKKEPSLRIKSIEDLDFLRSEINNGVIQISDAYEIIYNSKKKLYGTKYWKDIRNKLIKTLCENCTSTDKLTLQHTKQSNKRIDWTGKYEQMSGRRKEGERIILIMEHIDSFKEYMQCIHTKTLCNRCAYAEDLRGTTRCLCNGCKKNWVNDSLYPICNDCRNHKTICWHCKKQIVEDGNKYNGCEDCRKELILCNKCNKNYHTEEWGACYECNVLADGCSPKVLKTNGA